MSSSQATLAPSSAPPELAAFLDEARIVVERDLEARLSVRGADPGRLAEAMHYAATGPGKRLRPALVIAACEACGGTRAAALPAASAIEMLHAYTLVHDDLPAMDDDDERRGRPTVHVAFGEAIAILAGDGLLTKAFGTLAELGPRAAAAVEVLARRAGVAELLGGQAIDLSAAGRVPGAAREVLDGLPAIERLHAAKTGALFAAAAELGAIAANASPETCAALGRYGLAIGIAFQHADDRDDAELVEHAAAAAERMRVLCAEALAEVRPLSAPILDGFARWISTRA
ncbi:MAG TPA: polyprenyl synthetase family protein [Kofleriaceae bacterium]|jgi:geranylgeranyl pyrophosphate synthase|nr:polyprenyl synthetase family protein [Kofleriaceae bacterium]